MEIRYSELTGEQLMIINEYCSNDMKKLKQVCYFVWGKRGISYMEYDELYSDAMNVLVESVISYDEKQNCSFNTYLRSNLLKSYHDWYRDNFFRAKRSNLLLDKNGKIVRDEKGLPIIIKNISIDAPTEDGINLSEKISSNFDMENELERDDLSDEELGNYSPEMKEYLTCILSKVQRKILVHLAKGYSKEEIIEILHIDSALYSDSIAAITSNKNTRKIQRLIRRNK